MMELDGGAWGWGARQRDKGPPRRSWLVSAHPGASAVPVTPAAQRPGGRALYETVNNAEGRPDDKSDVHQSERQMGCAVDAVPHRGGRAARLSVGGGVRPAPPARRLSEATVAASDLFARRAALDSGLPSSFATQLVLGERTDVAALHLASAPRDSRGCAPPSRVWVMAPSPERDRVATSVD